MPKTKIICTIGPASESYSELRKMMINGMDVIRLNFSHGTHNEHLQRINLIRELNKKYRRSIKILGDLEGYRIRIGKLKEPVNLKKRQILFLTQKDIAGNNNIVSFDYEGNIKNIKKGMHIFIDDGNIGLKVIGYENENLKTIVITPGILKQHKGIVIPDLKIDFVGLKEKDKKDINFCIENNIDFIAQSFVRNDRDIIEIKNYIKGKFGGKIIAKIESKEGIKNLDKILKVSDGILVARGDMGVSLPIYEVPVMQKIIIKKCLKAKKIVITATQMLESMVENKIPTRAEVSDVANAILDGTNYVMLSAETAAGRHPALCVDMMNKIIKYTEKNINALSK